jgi:hypothetical protein
MILFRTTATSLATDIFAVDRSCRLFFRTFVIISEGNDH